MPKAPAGFSRVEALGFPIASRICPRTAYYITHPKEYAALPPKKKAGANVLMFLESERAQAMMEGRGVRPLDALDYK
ncbi:hypothetical protein KIPB_007664 [Kipferlia bialata]|uniref:Uncharacterized protein n=1 Tax=Kipferlia bialata TaxID=797122 RepID=A0A9K3CYW4_9EUKA|nr:hypothetical protein KIPB_007664 [Kipferlia bialata]|eukprot:g7664.t1